MIPYYQDEFVTIYNQNFRACLSSIKDGFIITDPPYNIGFKYDTYQDNLPDDEYIEMLCELQRFNKIAIVHYPEEMQRLVVPALGPPDHCGVWCYNSQLPRRFRLINWYGIIPDYKRIKQPYKNLDDKRIKERLNNGSNGTSIYEWWDDIQLVKNVSEEKTAHPCPIPLDLVNRIIILGASDRDLIIDPFCGSGTTLVAARDLGYKSIGCELSMNYCNIAINRLRQLTLPLDPPAPRPHSQQARLDV